MRSQFLTALRLFFLLSMVCGVFYPLALTGIAQLAFPLEANGSLIQSHGQVIGSSLIGQSFTSPAYFWSRPSATMPMANNGAASGGSNLAPSNPALIDGIKQRIAALKTADPDNTAAIPVDLVTASASGLDPDISLAAAYYQAARIARERALPLAQVRALISHHAQQKTLGLLGEARVNVLALNLALATMPK